VFIIDRPTCLLATILVGLALAALGALANNLLSAPRRLACSGAGSAGAEVMSWTTGIESRSPAAARLRSSESADRLRADRRDIAPGYSTPMSSALLRISQSPVNAPTINQDNSDAAQRQLSVDAKVK